MGPTLSRKLSDIDVDALFDAAAPVMREVSGQESGPLGPHENDGIETGTHADSQGSESAESNFRADTQQATEQRMALQYRLRDSKNGVGSIIGAPGDTLNALLIELQERYGDRLDLEFVREAFEERAAIMEFDAGMSRPDAEHAAGIDVLTRCAASRGVPGV
jgi:hypothetical protein